MKHRPMQCIIRVIGNRHCVHVTTIVDAQSSLGVYLSLPSFYRTGNIIGKYYMILRKVSTPSPVLCNAQLHVHFVCAHGPLGHVISGRGISHLSHHTVAFPGLQPYVRVTDNEDRSWQQACVRSLNLSIFVSQFLSGRRSTSYFQNLQLSIFVREKIELLFFRTCSSQFLSGRRSSSSFAELAALAISIGLASPWRILSLFSLISALIPTFCQGTIVVISFVSSISLCWKTDGQLRSRRRRAVYNETSSPSDSCCRAADVLIEPRFGSFGFLRRGGRRM
ncbi:hypothetical protein MPTK1_8g06930 [Marchantia polymorpha subsp. ruderalis]|uniref:Uncharacterized protein n=1 Tax=Marchantia polymorpha TaxID=3197 RepID=A0A2R6XIE3_MARPO|nr:hypothetical protein MARPO_0013s0099 [Marchantia polymorpha]BBN18973.1 hypothetical protein Mp_8g06930 [Marchantia polymorpha subsp. ruderalis]|eukprot:PTQ45873.1 hypothetical protein MARPO_0013s0099 [Marchantia polymorpha]